MNADLIVNQANVITIDDSNPSAEAFAVKDGKIILVGGDKEVQDLEGEETEVLSLGGKTVIPGFIDAHCHMAWRGEQMLKVNCGPDNISSIDDMIEELSAEAERTPKGEWIVGYNYDESKLDENRHPNRWELDEVSTEHPIYVSHRSLHAGVANSMALDKADIENKEGVVERDPETGELTGVMREDANYMFTGLYGGGIIPEPDKEDEQECLIDVCKEYNAKGITTVHEALATPSIIRKYQEGLELGNLTVRVYMLIWQDYLEHLKALNIRTGFGNDMVKIGAIKNIIDGAISARTAYLYEPYKGREDYYGDLRIGQEKLNKLVKEAHEADDQIGVHANGDKAIDMLLDAYEKALEDYPRENYRHRIEHGTVINDEIIERLKKLDVVLTPFTTYVYQHAEKMPDYGDRIEHMFPFGSCVENDISVAAGSDHPCGLNDPLLGIQTMVTRETEDGEVLGADEKVSVEDALKIYTLNGAYASFEEDIKGSISEGKLADFVILSDDPTSVNPGKISEISVEKTFLGGKEVFTKQ